MNGSDNTLSTRVDDADVEWLRMTADQLRRLAYGHGWKLAAADRLNELSQLGADTRGGPKPRDALWLSLAAHELRTYDAQFSHPDGLCGWGMLASDALMELAKRFVARPCNS